MAHSGVSGLWCMLSLVSGDEGGSSSCKIHLLIVIADIKQIEAPSSFAAAAHDVQHGPHRANQFTRSSSSSSRFFYFDKCGIKGMWQRSAREAKYWLSCLLLDRDSFDIF